MELITIACLDMAGTTVADDGGVLAAFAAAVGRCGLAEGTPAHDQAMKTAQVTMGQSKIEVFRQIFTDEADAQRPTRRSRSATRRRSRPAGSRRCPARPR